MSILIKNGHLITHDDNNRVLNKGFLLLENDKISKVGEEHEVSAFESEAETIIDANGRLVMPGLICTHMHFYSAFATGMPLDPFPPGFVNVLKHLWWKIDLALEKDDIYYSALLGYIQAVKSGTTTVVDHHASPSYIAGSLDLIEKASRELGVRSNLCYEVTDRNGEQGAMEGLKENERFISKSIAAGDDLIDGMVGLHASFTLSDDSLQRAAHITKKLERGVHVHVAEDKADMVDAKEKYGSTVLERLEKFNLLSDRSLLAHSIHIEESDYQILKKYKPNIAHQPRSNMNNAVGALDVFKLNENQIPFGMGTDGMSSDMKAEVMVGNLIHKYRTDNNTVGTLEIYDALFKTNRYIIKNLQNVNTGILAAGNKADVIVSNYYPKSPINSRNTIGHILFGMINEAVDTTIIDGKIVMRERNIPEIDERDISEACQVIAEKVWDRLP